MIAEKTVPQIRAGEYEGLPDKVNFNVAKIVNRLKYLLQINTFIYT